MTYSCLNIKYPTCPIAVHFTVAPYGILTIGAIPADPDNNIPAFSGYNLLTDYHNITQAQLTTAFNNCNNDRMYHCLKASITGDLKTVFDQMVLQRAALFLYLLLIAID